MASSPQLPVRKSFSSCRAGGAEPASSSPLTKHTYLRGRAICASPAFLPAEAFPVHPKEVALALQDRPLELSEHPVSPIISRRYLQGSGLGTAGRR